MALAPAPAARFLLATVLFQLIGFFLPQLDSGQLKVSLPLSLSPIPSPPSLPLLFQLIGFFLPPLDSGQLKVAPARAL